MASVACVKVDGSKASNTKVKRCGTTVCVHITKPQGKGGNQKAFNSFLLELNTAKLIGEPYRVRKFEFKILLDRKQVI